MYPAMARATVKGAPKIGWQAGDLSGSIEVNIDGGNATVNCEINKFAMGEPVDLIIRHVHFVTKMYTSMLAFNSGIAMTLVLDTAILPDGKLLHLIHKDPNLSGICSAFTVPKTNDEFAAKADGSFTQVHNLLLEDRALCVALSTLTESLELPDATIINCARAMEHIRNLVSPDQKRRDGWLALREVLNIDRPYLEFITNASTGPRHGDFTQSSLVSSPRTN